MSRRVSVSIAEPPRHAASDVPAAAAAAPADSAAAPAAKAKPAEVAAQMLASIPAKERELAKEWKVKQCVITRLDQGQGPLQSPQGVNLAPGASPSGPPGLGKLKKMGTSKMHKFTPPATLEQSVAWLSEYGYCEASVLFENHCAFMFDRGCFIEFEDMRDDDD